ncbi:RHS repeat protein [Solimonas fluminis]|nr:RHS repeat protein [Solimonas fluminis]
MRNGLLRFPRSILMPCLLLLLAMGMLGYTPTSHACPSVTTLLSSSPPYYATVGQCGSELISRDLARQACWDFVIAHGYPINGFCNTSVGPDGSAYYGAGGLGPSGPSSGPPYFLARYHFCEVWMGDRAVWSKDTLRIYDRNTNSSAACPAPPPVREERQSANNNICSVTGEQNAKGGQKEFGNPVDCTTGRKIQTEVDYADADFRMERSYSTEWLTSNDPAGWGFPRPQLSVTTTLSYDVAVFTLGNWRRVFLRSTGATNWTSSRIDDGELLQVNGQQVFRTATGRKYEFDSTGRLSARIEVDGRRLDVGYASNAYGGTTQVHTHSATGHVYQMAFDANGRIAEFVNPAGASIYYSWDVQGRLATVTYPDDTPLVSTDNPVRQYLYEDSANLKALTGIIDENGDRFATYAYDNHGRTVLSEHAGGAGRHSFDYIDPAITRVREYFDATRYTEREITFGTPASQRGPRVTSIAYTQCPDCSLASNTESYTYDSNGWLTNKLDRRGINTGYIFSNYGYEISRTEAKNTPLSRTISTGRNGFQQPIQVVQAGRYHYRSYNGFGQITQDYHYTTTGGSRLITNFGYDTSRRLISINGPRTDISDVTNFTYDSQRNVSQVTRPGNLITQITHYNASGQPLRILDPNGVETLLTYDARQRLLSTSTAGETTTLEYDKVGQLKKVTTPDGAWLAYSYDAAHRLTGIADPDGNRIEYTLDWAGNRTAEKVYDPANSLRRSQTRIYDGLSRLKEIQGADGQIRSFTYDGNGNLLTQTVDSRTTTHEYDPLERLTRITDPASGLTQYGYSAWDELTSVTDPRTLSTAYTVNTFGEVTQLQSPDTGTSTATYDSAGNLKTRTDAKGQVVTYSYDALNRLTQAAYTGGPSISYSYDAGPYGKGRLTGINGPGASLAWTYTPHGRVASQTQVVGARTLVTGYSYDSAGRLATQTLPSGKVVGYHWTLNRLTSVTLDGNPVASNLQDEPFGPIKQWDFANGEQVQKSFDLSGRMTAHSLGTLGYDTADRITGLTHGGLSHLTGTKTYGYDALDRLTSYLGASFHIGYGYDANGNRSQQTGTAGTTDYTTSPTSNRLDSLTDGVTTQGFSYDANGSLTADGSHTYGYDKTGRLTSVDGSTAYAYNGLGQRVSKTASGTGTVYAYDEAGHLVGEYDAATGNPIQETVWMGDTPLAVVKGSGTYYVHADHLNTPRQINDQAGDPVWVWDTITFGGSSPDEDPLATGTAFVYNLRLPGQYYDSETGLHQNHHREYSPPLGRYTEVDPLGLFGGSLSPYTYANQNPLSFTDPEGLLPQGFVDFSAGAGDVLTFGLTAQFRELTDIGTVDRCSSAYAYGEVAGVVGSIATGYLAGTKSVAKASSLNNWQNFSHTLVPRSVLKRFNNPFARWLNKTGNRLNGDHVPPEMHDLIDPVANSVGKSVAEAAKTPPFSPLRQLPNRVPYTPGAAVYGTGSAAMNSCECQ